MENEEPARDDAAKQKARKEEYKEKTEQLLEFHGQEKVLTPDPTMLLGALGAYLLFVGTVAAVGSLAASSNHKTTSEIFLVASGILVIIVPFGVIWYFLRVRTPKKATEKSEGKQSRLDAIAQSAIVRLSARAANNPVFRVVNLLLCIGFIADLISKFPLKPRSSLAFIALYTAIFSMGISLEIARAFEKAVQAQIKEMWEFNRLVQGVVGAINNTMLAMIKESEEITERHKTFTEAQLENNKATLSALVGIDKFVRVVANTEDPPTKLDAPPKPDEEPH